MGLMHYSVTCRSEYEAVEVNIFRLSPNLRFGVFAGPHREEEPYDHQVGNDGGSRTGNPWVARGR
jgi:hypothetical protein